MPVAMLVTKTVVRTKAKYSATEVLVNRTVESANIVKQTISTSRAAAIRNGYEAPDCSFARMRVVKRLATVEMEIMEDW